MLDTKTEFIHIFNFSNFIFESNTPSFKFDIMQVTITVKSGFSGNTNVDFEDITNI